MFLPDNTIYKPVDAPNKSPLRTQNTRLPMADRLTSFQEVEKTYTEEEALQEAARCYGCPTHWCTKACPANVPVTEFIARVREKDYEGAYQLISTQSTLPEFCSRLCPQEKQCQSNCTRSICSQAVGIGRLERFVTEQHYKHLTKEPVQPIGKRVAIVGSGPSGLSAAQSLVQKGYAVTVLEAADAPGGLLRYGIPEMKLPKETLDRKLAAMEAEGVVFQCNCPVDTAETAENVISEYDAVVLCAGTGNARMLSLIGADGISGINGAVPFLSGLGDTAEGKQVIIVGGGDTGNDCVGTCIRQGCTGITQIEMMPRVGANPVVQNPVYVKQGESKFDSSQEECLTRFSYDPHVYQATVKGVVSDEKGQLVGVTIVRLRAEYQNRRVTMVEIPGSEETIPCQLLIVAAGFLGPKPELAQSFGVETTPRSNIAANAYQTNNPKVFACGDCRTGQSLVVKAMVDGRECAKAVSACLEK